MVEDGPTYGRCMQHLSPHLSTPRRETICCVGKLNPSPAMWMGIHMAGDVTASSNCGDNQLVLQMDSYVNAPLFHQVWLMMEWKAAESSGKTSISSTHTCTYPHTRIPEPLHRPAYLRTCTPTPAHPPHTCTSVRPRAPAIAHLHTPTHPHTCTHSRAHTYTRHAQSNTNANPHTCAC